MKDLIVVIGQYPEVSFFLGVFTLIGLSVISKCLVLCCRAIWRERP